MNEMIFKGGIRYGFFNASWPFTKLIISKDNLSLTSPWIGEISFNRGDVLSVEKYRGILSKGIKINHNVPYFKKKVVFWTMQSPEEVLKKIHDLGGFDVNL